MRSRPMPTRLVSLLVLALLGSASAAAQQQAGAADTAKKTAPNSELPVIPARQAAFTTDEGTWMSLDVSPDGRTIVFDIMGDLYSVPIAGGKATRLTSGMGFDGQYMYMIPNYDGAYVGTVARFNTKSPGWLPLGWNVWFD